MIIPATKPSTCLYCGRTFNARIPDLKRGWAKFCGRTCANHGKAKPVEQRFWKYVDKNGPVPSHMPHLGPCWIWLAGKTKLGYAKFRPGGADVPTGFASHTSYRLHVGEIPEGLKVLHHCDNPECVNPDHLFVGTSADNTHDMMRKGRGCFRNERNGSATLNWDIVHKMRALWQTGKYTKAAIGKLLGVSRSSTHGVLTGTRWIP